MSLTTIYVTKYALTRGIEEYEARLQDRPGGGKTMAIVPRKSNMAFDQYFHEGEFFLTKKEAKADAEARREKKLKSLRKQIANIERVKF